MAYKCDSRNVEFVKDCKSLMRVSFYLNGKTISKEEIESGKYDKCLCVPLGVGTDTYEDEYGNTHEYTDKWVCDIVQLKDIYVDPRYVDVFIEKLKKGGLFYGKDQPESTSTSQKV